MTNKLDVAIKLLEGATLHTQEATRYRCLLRSLDLYMGR